MNKRVRKKRGFLLVELLIGIVIFVIIVGGLFAAYILIYRYWKSGDTQLKIQVQGRQVIKQMRQKILASNYVYPESGGSDIIALWMPQGKDDWRDPTPEVVNERRFWYVNYEGVGYILTDQNTESGDDDIILLSNVIIEDGENLFDINGKVITISFKLRDPLTADGYQGFDLKTKVYMRNE